MKTEMHWLITWQLLASFGILWWKTKLATNGYATNYFVRASLRIHVVCFYNLHKVSIKLHLSMQVEIWRLKEIKFCFVNSCSYTMTKLKMIFKNRTISQYSIDLKMYLGKKLRIIERKKQCDTNNMLFKIWRW